MTKRFIIAFLCIAIMSNIFSYILAVLPEPMYIVSIILYMCYMVNLGIGIGLLITEEWKNKW